MITNWPDLKCTESICAISVGSVCNTEQAVTGTNIDYSGFCVSFDLPINAIVTLAYGLLSWCILSVYIVNADRTT